MRRQTTPRTWIGTEAQVVRHVRVCGEGHLATATRIELERQGIHRDSDSLLPSLRPALIIACADSEADDSFNDAAQQAFEDGSPLLLCCLAGPVVRVGPLIEPCAYLTDAAWSTPTPTSPASPLAGAPTAASRSPPPSTPQLPPSGAPQPPTPPRTSAASMLSQPAGPTLTSAVGQGRPSHLGQRPRRSRYSRDKAESTLHP